MSGERCLINRQIFPDITLFKRLLTDQILVILQEIYRIHPAYPYKDDESKSKIQILPTYANPEYEKKVPTLLVKVGSYDLGFEDTIGKNYMSEVTDASGVVIGRKQFKEISTAVTITVKARAEEESSDLADELVALSLLTGQHMFTQAKIFVRRASVSETVETENVQDEYTTIINMMVDVPMEFFITNSKPEPTPDVEVDLPYLNLEEYLPPSVIVHKKKGSS